MVKFQKWHEEHEAAIIRRTEENKKNFRARQQRPIIRRVEDAVASEAISSGETSDIAE
jgi:small subunit ribosomal protein S16